MSESELILTLNDSGKSFDINPGDTVSVQLKENRTTPFRWAMDGEINTNILSFQKSQYLLPEKLQIGEEGMLNMTFKAESTGVTTIRLKHWCQWEGESSVIDRFNVTISVGK